MTIGEAISEATKRIQQHRPQTARLDADLLMMKVLSFRREDLLIHSPSVLEEASRQLFFSYVERRQNGEPVAYITGTKDFFGDTFHVGPGVLIPRPETEHLVEEILNWAKDNAVTRPRVVDLGCGSGCIGLSLLKNLPDASLVGVDVSAKAMEYSRRNAENLDLASRSEFFQCDISKEGLAALEPLHSRPFDVVVANPPYISRADLEVDADVVRHEPDEALFSGATGLEALSLWLNAIVRFSAAKSAFCFEIGHAQGPAALEVFRTLKVFDEVRLGRDYASKDRWILAQRKGVANG